MNPDSPDDLAKLKESWEMLSTQSIVFAGQCKWEKFSCVVHRYCHEWHNQVKIRKKPTRRSALGQCEYEPSAKRFCADMSQEDPGTNTLCESVEVDALPQHFLHASTRPEMAMGGGGGGGGGEANVDMFPAHDPFAIAQAQGTALGVVTEVPVVAEENYIQSEAGEAGSEVETGTTSPLPRWIEAKEH